MTREEREAKIVDLKKRQDFYYDKDIALLITLLEQEQKTGHWIRFKKFENGYYHIKCSECGQFWSVDGHAAVFKHCFNCGAKMESEE